MCRKRIWRDKYCILFFFAIQTLKIDIFAPYIGEKLRDFPREFNPNTEKLTLTLVLLTPTSNN